MILNKLNSNWILWKYQYYWSWLSWKCECKGVIVSYLIREYRTLRKWNNRDKLIEEIMRNITYYAIAVEIKSKLWVLCIVVYFHLFYSNDSSHSFDSTWHYNNGSYDETLHGVSTISFHYGFIITTPSLLFQNLDWMVLRDWPLPINQFLLLW